MKKLRKPISILLAGIMAVSVCTVGFSAFAATSDVEKQIEEATTFSDTLKNTFNALSDDDKNAMSPECQVRIYKLAYDMVNGEKLKFSNAENKILELLPPTEEFHYVWNLAKTMQGYEGISLNVDGTDYTAQDVAKAAKATAADMEKDADVKDLAEELINSYNALTDNEKYIFNCVYVANSTSEPKGPYAYIKSTAPTHSNLTKVLTIAANINTADKVSNEDLLNKTIEKVKLSSYKNFDMANAMATLQKMLADYNAYLKDNDKQKFLNVWNEFSTVRGTDPALLILSMSSAKIVYVDGAFVTISSAAGTSGAPAKAAKAIQEEINWNDFVTKLENAKIETPSSEYNKVIIALKEAYNQLTAAQKKNITEGQLSKYNQITYLAYYEGIAQDTHELFEAESVNSEMSGVLGSVVYETLLPSVERLLNDMLAPMLVPGANAMEALQAQFTNENVTLIAKWLMPILYDALLSIDGLSATIVNLLPLNPNQVGMQLKDEQFVAAGTASALSKYQSVSLWSEVPEDLNWGVIPGDWETFSTAVLSLFNGFSGHFMIGKDVKALLDSLLLDSGMPEEEGYVPGNWNTFVIPLMEALGVDSSKIQNSVSYTAYVKNNNQQFAHYLKPILDILYYQVLPELLADPVDYLAENLPNLLYHLEDGCILDGLDKLLDNTLSISVAGYNINLDIKSTLMGALADMNGGVAPEKINFAFLKKILDPMLAGAGLSIDQIMKISRLGEPQVVDTARIDVTSTVKVVADKTSVLNYLGNIINDLLGTIDLGNGMKLDFNVNKTFVKQEAPKYPHNGKMDKKVMNAMITGLDGLLGGFVNINDLINNGLCTQEMAANAITGIYGLLDSGNMDANVASILGALNLSIKPSDVAAALTEDIYKDLAADLTVAGDIWANVGLVIKNDDKVVSQTNMGFKDGDRDGFINCLAAGLRPLIKALADTGLITNAQADGETVYGLYETLIIPVFEALGITPATDSATFTANYNKLLIRKDSGVAYDYLIKTILDPILGLLNDVAAAPAATLMKLLPNLVYAVQYNPQLAFIGNLLDGMGGLTGILNGLLQGIATGEDADGNAVYGLKNFELPEIPLDALASCGQVKEVNSKSALHKTYTTVVADTADTFVTVFYYLYDAINYKSNLDTIKTLLAGIEGIDETMSTMINTILNDIFTLSKEEALCALGSLLASDIWECPNEDDNGGSKTPSTGDYAIPAAVFMLMMVSAGGAILLLKKRKPVTVK